MLENYNHEYFNQVGKIIIGGSGAFARASGRLTPNAIASVLTETHAEETSA
jgi:hypothetical protein